MPGCDETLLRDYNSHSGRAGVPGNEYWFFPAKVCPKLRLVILICKVFKVETMPRLIYALGPATGLSLPISYRGMWQRPSRLWIVSDRFDWFAESATNGNYEKPSQNKRINPGDPQCDPPIRRSADPNGFEGYVFAILRVPFTARVGHWDYTRKNTEKFIKIYQQWAK